MRRGVGLTVLHVTWCLMSMLYLYFKTMDISPPCALRALMLPPRRLWLWLTTSIIIGGRIPRHNHRSCQACGEIIPYRLPDCQINTIELRATIMPGWKANSWSSTLCWHDHAGVRREQSTSMHVCLPRLQSRTWMVPHEPLWSIFRYLGM